MITLRSNERRGDLAALAAGAVLPLGFAPFHWFPLAWFAPAALFVLAGVAVRGGFCRGFLFGVGCFGAGVSWVYVAIHDYGFTSMPVAAVLTVLFVAVLALYAGVFGAAAAWFRARLGGGAAAYLLAFPALWVAVEWFRGWFLTGFPWLSLGYSHIDTPLAHYAPVLGVYGVSLLVAMTAGAVALVWEQKMRALRLAVPVAAALWGGGAALGTIAWTAPEGEPLNVALVQGNLPQLSTWDPSVVQQRLDTYARLARSRLGSADLVVLPENAITLFYQDLRDNYFAELEGELRTSGTDLVTGVPLLDEDGERYYTTMMSLGSSHGFYRKSHLVPFGEFVPLESLLRGLIAFFDLPMSGFTPGVGDQGLLRVAGRPAAVSICYEDAFGSEIIRGLPEARLLINGSNNGWYGDSLAPHQHLQIARMRALETGRPLLRATTNGISALVDHHGMVVARSPQFETYVLDGVVQPMAGATPYVRFGDFPALFIIGVCLISVGCARIRRVRQWADGW